MDFWLDHVHGGSNNTSSAGQAKNSRKALKYGDQLKMLEDEHIR